MKAEEGGGKEGRKEGKKERGKEGRKKGRKDTRGYIRSCMCNFKMEHALIGPLGLLFYLVYHPGVLVHFRYITAPRNDDVNGQRYSRSRLDLR